MGALNKHTEYTFPAFYPAEFEYCNFITGYTLAKVIDDNTYQVYNNSIASMYDFKSIEAPVGMMLTDALTSERLPAVR